MVHPLIVERKQRALRVAHNIAAPCTRHHIESVRGVEQAGNLLVHIAEREGSCPLKIFLLYVFSVKRKLYATGAHIAKVGVFVVLATYARGTNKVN